MRVLLSIKPEHVRHIFDGSKRYEFRRKIFIRPGVRSVVIYSTKPVAMIVGEFKISQILSCAPEDLWSKTSSYSGIDKKYFDTYFHGCEVASAIEIGQVHIYDKPIAPKEIAPGFTPPQSYMYVEDAKDFEWLKSKQAELFE